MIASYKIVLIFVLLALSAFFSCSETAFFSLTRAQIYKLKSSTKHRSKYIIDILKRPQDILITVLLGNELVNIAFSIVIASAVYDTMGEVNWKYSTAISIAIAVPAVLIFGEIIPKNIALRFAPYLVPVLAVPLKLFSKITLPARAVLTRFANVMIRIFGGDPTQVGSMIMEEEFRQLVDLGYKEGVLEEGESELIHRIFELGNTTAGQIMTPAGQIFKLSTKMPFDDIIREMRDTQFNRVPVYREDPERIIGTLHARDLFKLYRQRQQGSVQEVEEIVRPIHVIRQDEMVEDLLSDLQRLKIHMALVVDHGRKIVGLVTMDDIFRLLFMERLEKRGSRK